MNEKFIKALARHELAQQEVNRLKSAIGEALAQCPIDRAVTDGHGFIDHSLFDEKGRTKTHLWQALQEVEYDEDIFPRGLDAFEIDDYLADEETGCPHCLEAWRLIMRRKAARQELGVAKRALRTLGKSAIKMTEAAA